MMMGACVQLECFACSSGSCPSSGQGAVHAVHAVCVCVCVCVCVHGVARMLIVQTAC